MPLSVTQLLHKPPLISTRRMCKCSDLILPCRSIKNLVFSDDYLLGIMRFTYVQRGSSGLHLGTGDIPGPPMFASTTGVYRYEGFWNRRWFLSYNG
jgi:hypothetical protein